MGVFASLPQNENRYYFKEKRKFLRAEKRSGLLTLHWGLRLKTNKSQLPARTIKESSLLIKVILHQHVKIIPQRLPVPL